MSKPKSCIGDLDALRLVAAYGFAEGAMAPLPPPPERPPYVPYAVETGLKNDRSLVTAETVQAASYLWAQGMTMKQICAELHITMNVLSGQMTRHRELFPYRRQRRKGAR